MSETIGVNVLRRAQDMDVSPQFNGYSGVRIFVGTDDNGDAVVIESGNADGRVLEIKNPLGTQAMADNILADIQGYQYQPLSAKGALLNPAAEMGDGVTVNGVYSGIFTRATQFGRLMASDISAPTDEEIEHEFAIENASDRQYTRFVMQTKAMLSITNQAITAEVEARTSADATINATLSVQATEIAARVSKQGSNGSNTFAWSLDSDGFYINDGAITQTMKDGKTAKFNFTSSGLKIQGEIRATTGTIGGFNIGQDCINYNNLTWNSNQSTGIYIGTSGIKLGQKFYVDTSGNMSATSLKLYGTLSFYNSNGTLAGTMSAADLRQGAKRANDGYSNWNSAYTSTSSGGYCYDGAGGGYAFKDATNSGSGNFPYFFKCTNFQADSIFIIGKGNLSTGSIDVPTSATVRINGVDYTVTLNTSSKKVWTY